VSAMYVCMPGRVMSALFLIITEFLFFVALSNIASRIAILQHGWFINLLLFHPMMIITKRYLLILSLLGLETRPCGFVTIS
jgi:hypothetical protein